MKDPRRTDKGNIQYSVGELFFLTLAGILCGCDSWESIAMFGKLKATWFREFFPYRKGTPSQDTLERFFGKLSKESFGECFINWASRSFKSMENEVISIDGKRLRGSFDKGMEQAAVHVVSAYASANRLTLGQVATREKSNEITAIPQLIDLLDLEHTTVSIDAMGCQKEIVRKIREKNADYLIAVKENQSELLKHTIESFQRQVPESSHTSMDKGHGRLEKRTCDIITDLKWMETKEQWLDLNTVIRIQSERTNILSGENQRQTRYYISNKPCNAENFNHLVRAHWAIENNLHWVLDVTFGEDKSRRRKGNSAYNFNVIAKIALKILEKNKKNLTKPLTRLKAAHDDQFRTSLFQYF